MTSLAMVRWYIGDFGRRVWHAVMPLVIETLALVIAGALPFTIGFGFERLRFSTGGPFLLGMSLVQAVALLGIFLASFTMKDCELRFLVPRTLFWIGWPASVILTAFALLTSPHKFFWFSWFPVNIVILLFVSYAMNRYAEETTGKRFTLIPRKESHGIDSGH